MLVWPNSDAWDGPRQTVLSQTTHDDDVACQGFVQARLPQLSLGPGLPPVWVSSLAVFVVGPQPGMAGLPPHSQVMGSDMEEDLERCLDLLFNVTSYPLQVSTPSPLHLGFPALLKACLYACFEVQSWSGCGLPFEIEVSGSVYQANPT